MRERRRLAQKNSKARCHLRGGEHAKSTSLRAQAGGARRCKISRVGRPAVAGGTESIPGQSQLRRPWFPNCFLFRTLKAAKKYRKHWEASGQELIFTLRKRCYEFLALVAPIRRALYRHLTVLDTDAGPNFIRQDVLPYSMYCQIDRDCTDMKLTKPTVNFFMP